MSTHTATVATASILLDSETYVAKGATANYKGTSAAWSAEFRALGGESAVTRAAWQTGAPSMSMVVSGTDEAIAFAIASAPLAA